MVEAENEWEWWAPKAANVIFQGIFADQTYEEAVETLRPWWYIQQQARLAQVQEQAASDTGGAEDEVPVPRTRAVAVPDSVQDETR